MFKKIISYLIFFFITFSSLVAEEYFLTLRNEKTNLRQGPSFDYPIKIFYTKKGLPVLVQDVSENFRKIRDHENNTGWIHRSQLSEKKGAIVDENRILVFKKPTVFSKPIVILQKGRLCLVDKCKEEWCKIMTGKYTGWVYKKDLWGKFN